MIIVPAITKYLQTALRIYIVKNQILNDGQQMAIFFFRSHSVANPIDVTLWMRVASSPAVDNYASIDRSLATIDRFLAPL